jgi:EAL domain-containing protein (putative c-di-GMP-specific phosphodiesterase class I)
MGLRVVAEGVESESQLATLRELGCDEVQGHVLGRPLAAAEVIPWLVAHAERRP